jgi:hypothetical protein
VTIYSYRGYIIMADAKGKENEFIGFPEDLTEKGKKKGAST